MANALEWLHEATVALASAAIHEAATNLDPGDFVAACDGEALRSNLRWRREQRQWLRRRKDV